jgi:hypothetical protein
VKPPPARRWYAQEPYTGRVIGAERFNRLPKYHLPSELTLADAFRFPIATKEARRDVLIGGCLIIFLLFVGWILNLGNRLNVVSRLSADDRPYFRGFRPWGHTFKRGCISFVTISSYLAPAAVFGLLAFWCRQHDIQPAHYSFAVLSGLAFCLGVFTLPGCMTVYAVEGDPTVLRQPIRAFSRAWLHRRLYLYAWSIALLSIVLSLLGLLALGVGFFFTSVWAWDVVGYAFTIAMYSSEESAVDECR